MVFADREVSVPRGLKVGDTVRFQPERINGQLTITKIERQISSALWAVASAGSDPKRPRR